MEFWSVTKCINWSFHVIFLVCVVSFTLEAPSIFMQISMQKWNPEEVMALDMLINSNKSKVRSSHNQQTSKTRKDVDDKTAELQRIHDFIYETLDNLQNEGDCEKKKIIRCTNSHMSGFGSTIHRHVICVHIAFALGRAFFIDQEGWEKFNGLANFTQLESGKCGYLKTKMKTISDRCNFNDLNCYVNKDGLEIDNRYKLLEFTREADFPAPKFIPGTLPPIINERLQKIGVKNPWHWFTSQLLGYMIMRPNESFEKKYKNALSKSRLRHPMLGMHFRGTDKVFSESRYISPDTYIKKAVRIFNENINSSGTRYIYLASDETRILRKLKRDLKDSYVIQGNPLGSSLRHIGRRDDTSRDVIERMLMDLYFMVRCDYAIVTYSSNIGRLIWELKTSRYPFNVGDTITSMDYKNMFYAWYAYEATAPYFLTIRDNNKTIVDGFSQMPYKKGQLFHQQGHSFKTVVVKGIPTKLRPVRLYRKDTTGYILENNLVPWPGVVHYENDMKSNGG